MFLWWYCNTTILWHNNTMTIWHNDTTTDPNMVFMYCVVVRCLKKKNIPSRTPPTNGTPLPLCAIFRITLLVSCLKKKNNQSKTPPTMEHFVIFSRYSSHWSILTSCQCLKKKNIWSIPSHNGTPLLLHDPFWIWLPLIDVLTSCQHLKKNNIQSRTPPTMEYHLCFLLFQDTAVCCPWKQIKTVLSLLHSTVVIHDSKKEQHDQVVHPQENIERTLKK